MAEISEEPQPPPPSQQPQGEPEFDPNTLRKTKPGVKRLVLTVTVLLSFLLGFPFLWKSVEIYRSPLPFADIDNLSNDVASSFPLSFPFHFHAIFVTSKPDLNPDDLRLSLLLSQITKLPSLSPLNFTLSVTVDSAAGCERSLHGDENSESGHLYKCGAIRDVDFADEDEDVLDERLSSVLDDRALSDGRKVYSVVVVVEDSGGKAVRAVVGKYRHAWIVAGSEFEAEAMVERAADIFLKVFVNGGKEEGLIHGEFMPVGADGRIVLSFNLLNANPRDWIYDW